MTNNHKLHKYMRINYIIFIVFFSTIILSRSAFADPKQDFDKALQAYERKEFTVAIDLFKKSAEAGFIMAQQNLAWMYENGIGTDHSYKNAYKWRLKAAERGVVYAQNDLGSMYLYGRGVPQNYIDATKWFQKAAYSGLAKAQFNLAVMYQFGRGVPKNTLQAAKWYSKAAIQGEESAQYQLGKLYLKGDGVIKENVFAYMWFNISASQGYTKAIKARDELAMKMSQSDLEYAQSRAKLCVMSAYRQCE